MLTMQLLLVRLPLLPLLPLLLLLARLSLLLMLAIRCPRGQSFLVVFLRCPRVLRWLKTVLSVFGGKGGGFSIFCFTVSSFMIALTCCQHGDELLASWSCPFCAVLRLSPPSVLITNSILSPPICATLDVLVSRL
jgi:hypothetical protein